MIQKIDHVTINVKDIEKTLQFYGKLLELEQLPSVDMGDHTLSFFKLPSGEKIELVQYHFPTEETAIESSCRGTARHFAFEVDHIKGLEEKLENAGYHFHSPVTFIEKLGFWSGLVKDPNGFELEFIQY